MATRILKHLMAPPEVGPVRSEIAAPLEATRRVPSGWDHLQHILDVALILTAAPVWTSLLVALMMAKRYFDGSPVFFHHVRVGRNGRTFRLHKIRTTASDFQARPQDWPDENYPPRTRFGNWLRRCDLDELPQLWNVLKGEMSLIGPRPETPYHFSRFAALMPRYGERSRVRPGLSGLAQLRGLRGNTDVDERLRADLQYIAVRGWRVYTSILFGTVWLEIRQAPVCSRILLWIVSLRRGADRRAEDKEIERKHSPVGEQITR